MGRDITRMGPNGEFDLAEAVANAPVSHRGNRRGQHTSKREKPPAASTLTKSPWGHRHSKPWKTPPCYCNGWCSVGYGWRRSTRAPTADLPRLDYWLRALEVSKNDCHCYENELPWPNSFRPALSRKPGPGPWTPACAGATVERRPHFHRLARPSQGHSDSERSRRIYRQRGGLAHPVEP